MRYEDMTKREQLLSRNAICPICHTAVDKLEDVQIVKMKYGKRVIPFYIHSACLLNAMTTIASSQLGASRKEVENAKERA